MFLQLFWKIEFHQLFWNRRRVKCQRNETSLELVAFDIENEQWVDSIVRAGDIQSNLVITKVSFYKVEGCNNSGLDVLDANDWVFRWNLANK